MTRPASRLHRPLAAASLFATLLLAGCAGSYGNYEGSGPMSNREAARMAQEQDLERRVMAALQADPRVGAAGLKVVSQGNGVVMIGGTPANGIEGRTLALRIAERVPGVRRAINNMVMN